MAKIFSEKELVSYIKGQLKDLKPYVIGKERPHDIFDCGYSDGTWNAYIDVLDQLGVNHKYPKQY